MRDIALYHSGTAHFPGAAPLRIVVATLGLMGAAGTAQAGCGSVDRLTLAAKFSEAATLCSGAPAPAAAPVTTPVAATPAVATPAVATLAAAVMMPASVPVLEERAPVAIRMAGARRAVAVGRSQGAGATPRALSSLVHRVARSYRIDPALLASIVRTESAGRSNAVSHKGALGLMQVMPGTARAMGVRDPRQLLIDDELSLRTGARYLKHLQDRLGNNVVNVVAAYNAGPGAVAKAGMQVPNYRETQGYVTSVMGRYQASRLGRR